jgi:hypothetical protein
LVWEEFDAFPCRCFRDACPARLARHLAVIAGNRLGSNRRSVTKLVGRGSLRRIPGTEDLAMSGKVVCALVAAVGAFSLVSMATLALIG